MSVPDDLQDELDEIDPDEVTRLLGVQRPSLDVPPGALDPKTAERRALLAATAAMRAREDEPPSTLRPLRGDRKVGAIARGLVAARGVAALPLATGGAACTLGAAVLHRAAEDLTNLATRVSGVRG